MVTTKQIQVPVKKETEKTEATVSMADEIANLKVQLAELSKKMENVGYDGKYQEGGEKPTNEPDAGKHADEVPGVPGTHVEENVGYDGKYQEGEMETCDKCGSQYKKAKHDEPDGDEGCDHDDDGDEKMKSDAPKKEEVTAPVAKVETVAPETEKQFPEFGKFQVLKPTKEELAEARNTHINMAEALGKTKKARKPTIMQQATEWAITEMSRLSGDKK